MGHSGTRCYLPSLDFVGDVAHVLGRATGDEGQLCGDVDGSGVAVDIINKYAKFKPCRNIKKANLTLEERQDLYFGLDITPCGPNGNVADFISRYSSEWKHLKPRGLAYNERFRIADFDGYENAAGEMFNFGDMTFPTEHTLSSTGVGQVSFHLGLNPAVQLAAGSLLLTDLLLGGSSSNISFADCYFGLLFVNGNERRLITASSPLSNNAYWSEIVMAESNGAIPGLNTGITYTYYPVLSRNSRSSLTNFSNNDEIVSLPLHPSSFIVRNAAAAQQIAIHEPEAAFIRNRLNVVFTVGMSGNPSSMSSASYEIHEASAVGDTSGALLASGTIINQLTTTNPVTVERSIQTTLPNWVRIYVYNTNNQIINAEAYVAVTEP